MGNFDFSIVLPAYNESESLPDVLKDLKRVLSKTDLRAEIVAVDNGSRDGTNKALESLKKEIPELKILRIEKNMGWGNGAIKGLEIAQGPILGYMVADGQVRSEDPINVYRKLKQDNLDFCKGLRVNRYDDGLARGIASQIYNFLFHLMFHCPLKDVNAGPKFFTRNFYEIVKPESKDSFIDSEILIKAKDHNFLVGDFPVVSLVRKNGKSSVSILTALEFLKNMFYWFLLK